MKPKARQENIVVQDLNDETLIYDLITNQAFCLNETSSFVWNACDGQQSVSELAQALAKKTKQSINEDIIWLAIEKLEKDNLMAEAVTQANPLTGISRREVVKRVGLATMIALPIVTGLIAPTAANAASEAACPPLVPAATCTPNTAACNPSGNNTSACGGGNTGRTCAQACAPFGATCCSCAIQFAIDRRPSFNDCFCACQ